MRAQRALPFVLDLIILAIVFVGVTRHFSQDAQPPDVVAHGEVSSPAVAR
jgi:hypothetical protein